MKLILVYYFINDCDEILFGMKESERNDHFFSHYPVLHPNIYIDFIIKIIIIITIIIKIII